MSFLSGILGAGSKGVLDGIGGIIGKFVQSPEEKNKALMEMEQLLAAKDAKVEETIQAEMDARKEILVAELESGDNYTRRARPTLVYAGLAFIFLNHVFFPVLFALTKTPPVDLALPVEFWVAWTGTTGAWSIGRTMERRKGGTKSKALSLLTGAKLI